MGCSPRVRGWSQDVGHGRSPHIVLPARAGVVPQRRRVRLHLRSAPRACGGGPSAVPTWGRARSCSPRVRGWSRRRRDDERRAGVLPARAGVVPPVKAGVGDHVRAPRACGGGPPAHALRHARRPCSPRVRGWSRCGRRCSPRLAVLPARAGMDPAARRGRIARRHTPRAWPGMTPRRGLPPRPPGAPRPCEEHPNQQALDASRPQRSHPPQRPTARDAPSGCQGQKAPDSPADPGSAIRRVSTSQIPAKKFSPSGSPVTRSPLSPYDRSHEATGGPHQTTGGRSLPRRRHALFRGPLIGRSRPRPQPVADVRKRADPRPA